MSIRVHPWLFSDFGLGEASGGSKRLENAQNGLKIAKNGPKNTKFGRKTGKSGKQEARRLDPVFLLVSCFPAKNSRFRGYFELQPAKTIPHAEAWTTYEEGAGLGGGGLAGPRRAKMLKIGLKMAKNRQKRVRTVPATED